MQARAVSKSRSLNRVRIDREKGKQEGASRKREEEREEKRAKKRRSSGKEIRAFSPPHLRIRKLSVDFTLVFIVAILVAFGLIVIYSSSSYIAALGKEADPAFYLKKQLISVVVGFLMMIIAAQVTREFYRGVAWPFYGFSVVMVLLVPIIGVEINNAKRWIRIAGMSVQPAEFMKIAIILVIASFIAKRGRRAMGTLEGVIPVFIISGIPAVMVWVLTSNLSSAIIIFGIAFLMLFVSSPTYKEYLILVGSGVAAVAGLAWYAKDHSLAFLGYRGTRIVSWLNPSADASGAGFQTLQALYAIGSGGLGGKGLGRSMQKLGFLPEAQNDMIFSIICEELGMIGAIAIMVLFLALIYKLVAIATQTEDLFGMLIVTGVLSHLSLQVLLNIAVVTNTIPNTGISLPFISYGGTAIICQLAEIGMVLGIERHPLKGNQ